VSEVYLECKPCLDLVSQDLSNATIKVCEDLHCQLGLDTSLADQIVEGVRQSHADARCAEPQSVSSQEVLCSIGTVPATAVELVKGLSIRRHCICSLSDVVVKGNNKM
jgi:hypothetical protein